MNNPDLKHLFTPGTGAIPPYLAGRKQEQEYFRDCIEVLKNRKPVSRDMIVYGPRGNGKTALLRYLQKETLRQEGTKLDIIWGKPFQLETRAGLENLITGNDRKLRGKIKNVELSTNIGIAGASIELDYSEPAVTLMSLLHSRSQAKPVILIMDEAHTLKPEIGKILLNISQDLRSEDNPFLLVLAGTPNLRATLARANASFWDRNELFPLGRLSTEEAEQAITVPLQEAGVSFAPGILEEIVDRTHCYPFFLQIWGDCLARQLHQTGVRVVSADTISEVEATTTSKRDAMYQVRFEEIKKMGLLTVAESVAHAFIQSGADYLHERTLDEAIAKGMTGDDEPVTSQRIMEKFDQLSHLGYIWRVGGYDYEPGIPSLMSFVQGYSQPGT